MMRKAASLTSFFFLLVAGTASALTLEGVRVGAHREFSRIVLDFDLPLSEYQVYRGPAGQTLWVVTPARMRPGLALPSRLPRGLSHLSLSRAGESGSQLSVGVFAGSKVRSFRIGRDAYGTHRLVVDVLRPAPRARRARIERNTSIEGRPWRPVAAISPPPEARTPPVSSPPSSPKHAPEPPASAAPRSEAKAEMKSMTPALESLPAPPPVAPKGDATRPPLAQKASPAASARGGEKRAERRPRGGGSFFHRLGRFAKGADLKRTLPNVHGPIPLRFNNPLHVLLYQFIPDRAALLTKGAQAFRLDFNESHALGQLNAVNESDGTSPIDSSVSSQIFTHLEVSGFRFHYDYGVLDWLQAGIEIPVLYHHVNSFSNELKEAFEKYISGKRSLLNVILNKRPDLMSTRFFIKDGDKTLFDSNTDTAGLGEMALRAKFRVLRETKWIPAASFRAALKLPTATNDQFGSDGVDGAFGVLIEKALLDSLTAYFNYNLTIPSDPFDTPGLKPQDFFTYWTFALEWDFFKRWALVGQFSGSSAPYEAPPGTQEDTKLTELIASPSFVMASGLRVAVNDRWTAMGGFQTDVVGRVGATADETTLFLSVGYTIPSKRSRR
ncbi:MAG: hypothetical protein ACE5IM_01135 [Nitrospinota bacterium]